MTASLAERSRLRCTSATTQEQLTFALNGPGFRQLSRSGKFHPYVWLCVSDGECDTPYTQDLMAGYGNLSATDDAKSPHRGLSTFALATKENRLRCPGGDGGGFVELQLLASKLVRQPRQNAHRLSRLESARLLGTGLAFDELQVADAQASE